MDGLMERNILCVTNDLKIKKTKRRKTDTPGHLHDCSFAKNDFGALNLRT